MPDVDKLLAAIDAAEDNAYGSDSDGDLSTERAQLIDHYLGKNLEPAPDGRSQVVDRSVYETIQWISPSLSRIFANGDDVVEIAPVGPEDEAAAKQESQYLNHIILQRNNWFETFTTASKDALLTKAGYLYAYREKKRQVELEKYERQTAQGVALVTKDGGEIIELNEYPDPDGAQEPVIDPMTGQPAVDPMSGQPVTKPLMLYDFEVRRTNEDTKYCIRVLPPERCKISEQTETIQLTESPYFEYYDYPTISDLRAEGYEIEDDIADGDELDTEEDASRDMYGELRYGENQVDPAMRRVRCRWVWIRHDYDEDGIAELQYCVIVAKELLHREEVNEIPVAVLCPDPLPHRHVGLCPADTTVDIQRIKTAILRQGLDNLYLSNNPRTFLNDKINLDDFLVSRPGGVIRGKPGAIYGQDIAPIVAPFVFPQAMEGLEYMDQVRENRTGTNRYFTGIDQNAMNKTATGIQQLSTMAAQRVEQIARHYSNGIERLASILHALIMKGGHRQDVVKLSGKWEQIDPATWRRRTEFRISVGYAAGNKDAMVNRLMLIAQMQEKAAAGGLPIVQPQNMYETAIELTKASDFAAPQRFWTEPSKAPTPKPPQPDVTVMAMEQIKAQSAQQTEQVKAQTAMQTKQMDVEQRERDSERDFAIKKYEIDADCQLKAGLAAAQSNDARDLESHKAQLNPKTAESNAKVKQTEGLTQFLQALARSQQEQTQRLEQTLSAAFEGLSQAIAASNAPRRLVRDKSGRVERSEPVLQ